MRLDVYLLVLCECVHVGVGYYIPNLSPLYKVMSRNVSSVSLSSYVNLIVWCNLVNGSHVCFEFGCGSSPNDKNVINEPFP